MLGGEFEIQCGGEVHTIEISDDGELTIPGGEHDIELERALQALGGEPSACLKFYDEHLDVIRHAIEEVLERAFYTVFDEDQMDISYGDPDVHGFAMPEYAYETEMSFTETTLEVLGYKRGGRYGFGEMYAKASDLDMDVSPYSSDVFVSGRVLYYGKQDEGLREFLPNDVIVLAEGSLEEIFSLEVDDSWVEHGFVDADDVDDSSRTDFELRYEWCIYTTQSRVNEKRDEKFEESVRYQLEAIDAGLNSANELAEAGSCEEAYYELAQSVYTAYSDLAVLLQKDFAEGVFEGLRDYDVRHIHKMVDLDYAWLHEMEHDCSIVPPPTVLAVRHYVLEFFQRVWNKIKPDESEKE
jgi:hypothetical protein